MPKLSAALMAIVARTMTVLGRLLHGMFRSVAGLVIVGLLALNLALVAIPAVFNAAAGIVWGAVSLVSEGFAARQSTVAAKRADVEERAKAVRTREDHLVAERDRLRTERTRVQTRLRAVEVELEGARRQGAVANRAVSDLRAERRNLLAERARTERRLQAFQIELDAARRRAVAAQQAASELRGVNAGLAARAQLAESEMAKLAAREQAAKDRAGQIVARMQRRAVRMVSRNTASSFLAVLPAIGTVTVVGVIAWDIYDTCAQLSDMGELRQALELGEEEIGSVPRFCGLSHDGVVAALAPWTSSAERACINARRETQTLDPPECVGMERVESGGEFVDPLDQLDARKPALPPMNDY